MDDPTVDGPRVPDPDEPGGEERPAGGGSRGPGRGTTLVALGVMLGLAAGWILWRGTGPEGGGARAGAAAAGGEIVEGVDVSGDPVLGPADAPVTIVEFSDFECPYCARFATLTAPLLRDNYGDSIRWIFVNNPLRSIHPRAHDAALAGECAAGQGRFWEFYDAVFARRDLSNEGLAAVARDIGLDVDAFERCFRDAEYAEEVAADMKEGQKFYILGTPTFFINGRRLEGAQPPEAFAAVIDSILAEGS